MTDDELVRRLDDGPFNKGPTANLHKRWDEIDDEMQLAAARIRELKAELERAKCFECGTTIGVCLKCNADLEGVHHGTHVIVPKPEWEYLKGFHDGVCKNGTHVVVPVEQPTIPELPNDMQEFADRHKLGTFIQEVWRQAFRDAHRAMIRAAQPERQQGE